MKIINTVKIELLPADMKEIISEHLKKIGYLVERDNVHFNVERRYEGIGPMEHEVIALTGCTCTAQVNHIENQERIEDNGKVD